MSFEEIEILMARVTLGTTTDADRDLLRGLMQIVSVARSSSKSYGENYESQTGVLLAILEAWDKYTPAVLDGAL